jgi:hypothetical protein
VGSGSRHLRTVQGRRRITTADTVEAVAIPLAVALELTDFKRDLSELTERLGQAQDCL